MKIIIAVFCFLVAANAKFLGFLDFLSPKSKEGQQGDIKFECLSVQPNNFYPSGHWSFHGLNNGYVLSKLIRFSPDTAKYLFPKDNEKGHLCSTSWNKLYGTTRCGYLDLVHQDSDRFVWRRAQSCLIYDGNHVIGEVPNCPQKNQIEIAAYTYDNGTIPYQHIGTLLKEFKATVEVNVWYNYTLTISDSQTVFTLAHENGTTIETQFVLHRGCSNQNHGNLQSLYFGGQCEAPQEVTVCYSKDK